MHLMRFNKISDVIQVKRTRVRRGTRKQDDAGGRVRAFACHVYDVQKMRVDGLAHARDAARRTHRRRRRALRESGVSATCARDIFAWDAPRCAPHIKRPCVCVGRSRRSRARHGDDVRTRSVSFRIFVWYFCILCTAVSSTAHTHTAKVCE